jgi:hypothetical protein
MKSDEDELAISEASSETIWFGAYRIKSPTNLSELMSQSYPWAMFPTVLLVASLDIEVHGTSPRVDSGIKTGNSGEEWARHILERMEVKSLDHDQGKLHEFPLVWQPVPQLHCLRISWLDSQVLKPLRIL